jgi:hypothetical protein
VTGSLDSIAAEEPPNEKTLAMEMMRCRCVKQIDMPDYIHIEK